RQRRRVVEAREVAPDDELALPMSRLRWRWRWWLATATRGAAFPALRGRLLPLPRDRGRECDRHEKRSGKHTPGFQSSAHWFPRPPRPALPPPAPCAPPPC